MLNIEVMKNPGKTSRAPGPAYITRDNFSAIASTSQTSATSPRALRPRQPPPTRTLPLLFPSALPNQPHPTCQCTPPSAAPRPQSPTQQPPSSLQDSPRKQAAQPSSAPNADTQLSSAAPSALTPSHSSSLSRTAAPSRTARPRRPRSTAPHATRATPSSGTRPAAS